MIPKKLNILGTDYKVILKELIESSMGSAQGCCDKNGKTIVIHSTLELKDLLVTYIHEVGHGMFREAGWDCAISGQLEEAVVEVYANFIVKNFIDVEGMQAEIDELNKKNKKKRK